MTDKNANKKLDNYYFDDSDVNPPFSPTIQGQIDKNNTVEDVKHKTLKHNCHLNDDHKNENNDITINSNKEKPTELSPSSNKSGLGNIKCDSNMDEKKISVISSPTSLDPKELFYSQDIKPQKGQYLEFISHFLSMASDAINTSPFKEIEFAGKLCSDAIEVLAKENSLLDIKQKPGETLILVGDIHGQFVDLVTHVLSQQTDLPEKEKDRRFLFLGDFVDRGPSGVEVMMLLLALKIEYPTMIYLLRGNHEEVQTSRIYGFYLECQQKFSDSSIFIKFNTTFAYLPLAAFVETPNYTFFCTHGGLSPNLIDISDVAKLSRIEYGTDINDDQDSIINGLLWSDPSDEIDDYEHNDRGCGYIFGVKATKEFCDTNKIDLLVRAHQLTAEGYCYTHNNKCLTIFSAPNYCGINNNKGAIAVVTDNIKFIQYNSASSPTNRPMLSAMPWSSIFS